MKRSRLMAFGVLFAAAFVFGGCSAEAGADRTFEANVCSENAHLNENPFGAGWTAFGIVNVTNKEVRNGEVEALCAKSADAAACTASVRAALTGSGWVHTEYSGCCRTEWQKYAVGVRGAEVHVAKNDASLVQIFGSVNSFSRASTVLSLHSLGPQCKRDNIRKAGTSFEAVTTYTDSCGAVSESLYSISPNAELKELETVQVSSGGSCVS